MREDNATVHGQYVHWLVEQLERSIQRFMKAKCTEDVALRNALYVLFRVEGMTVEQAKAARDRIAPRVPGSVLEIRERDE